MSTLIAFVFLALIALAVFAGKIPPLVFGLYLVVNALTFILYARDKSAARQGAWRTPENTLHLFALLGGWPGALIAQQRLRHKSSKRSFLLVFYLTVVLNCSAFLWLIF